MREHKRELIIIFSGYRFGHHLAFSTVSVGKEKLDKSLTKEGSWRISQWLISGAAAHLQTHLCCQETRSTWLVKTLKHACQHWHGSENAVLNVGQDCGNSRQMWIDGGRTDSMGETWSTCPSSGGRERDSLEWASTGRSITEHRGFKGNHGLGWVPPVVHGRCRPAGLCRRQL